MALAGMTIVAFVPTAVAPYAKAAAWFPADRDTSPRDRTAGSIDNSLLNTPRGLNEPVFWNSSAFRYRRTPSSSPTVADDITGVACTRPPIRARARSISSSSSSMPTLLRRLLAGLSVAPAYEQRAVRNSGAARLRSQRRTDSRIVRRRGAPLAQLTPGIRMADIWGLLAQLHRTDDPKLQHPRQQHLTQGTQTVRVR